MGHLGTDRPGHRPRLAPPGFSIPSVSSQPSAPRRVQRRTFQHADDLPEQTKSPMCGQKRAGKSENDFSGCFTLPVDKVKERILNLCPGV